MNFTKIANFIDKGNKYMFDIPVEIQKAYLKKLGQPKDYIDRSYKQYKCQSLFVPWYKVFLLNCIAFFILPIYIGVVLLITAFSKYHPCNQIDIICENKGMKEVLPQELTCRYILNFDKWNSGSMLNIKDVLFIIMAFFKTWSPYMILKCVIKLSRYSYMINNYHPKAIQVYGEYSFTSSFLTDYCHLYRIKHINVMHGEKLFFIRDAYFHFDECYVWGEHYISLFTSMYAEASQFKVAIPPSLQINCDEYYNPEAYADYKYYLASNKKDEIESISHSLQFAKKLGKTIKVRLHPRYSDVNVVRKYFDESEIEYPDKVSILESVSNLDFAIGLYTTVLTQAYFAGKKIIIDDVTYYKKYCELKDYHYYLSNKCPQTLSQYQIEYKF